MSSDRNPPPSLLDLGILLGILLGAIAVIVLLFNGFVNLLIAWIPPQFEQQLGALMIPQLEEQATEPDTQQELNQLLDRLEAHLPDNNQRDYRLLYIPDKTVNAMAVPGDVVVIYQGLLAQMESENELMMVLGHELGHFANRDHLRGLGRAIALQIAVSAIFGDTSGLPGLATAAVERLGQARFSQAQEEEADAFGLDLLQAEYGHVAGATDFFARLDTQSGVDWDFLATHPAPGKRVKILNRRIEKLGYTQESRSPLNVDFEAK